MSARSLIPSLTLVLLLSLGPATAAHADGKFYPSYEVANHPTIPSQRAMIVYRDGVETMIVESTVEEAGESFSWILPLPGAPTSIEAGTPGTLETMTRLVQPKIIGVHAGGEWLRLGALVLASGIVIALHIRAGRAQAGRAERIIFRTGIPLVFILILLAWVLLLPSLAKGTRSIEGASPPVVIIDTQRVGDYDITVIQGESGSAVRDWLTDNGYACDDESLAVLDKYASEGWCFAAAKLTADASRTVTPHPLEVTFPCEAPIYPMRLTGVEAIDLQLDLFIIADRRARADHLDCWQADRLRTAVRQYTGSTGRLAPPLAERLIVIGDAFGTSIGHPRVVGRCWKGCVLTHLRGVLSPEQMQEDIAIGLANHAAFRQHIYAPAAAWGIIFGVLVMIIGAALPIAAVSAYRGERRPRFLRRRWVAGIVLLVIVAPIVAYQCLDVQPVRRGVSPLRTHLATMRVVQALRELPAQADIESASDLRALLDNELGGLDPELNVWLHLDAPACYTAVDDEAGILVTLYDRIGIPLPVLIPSDGGDLLWDAAIPDAPSAESTDSE